MKNSALDKVGFWDMRLIWGFTNVQQCPSVQFSTAKLPHDACQAVFTKRAEVKRSCWLYQPIQRKKEFNENIANPTGGLFTQNRQLKLSGLIKPMWLIFGLVIVCMLLQTRQWNLIDLRFCGQEKRNLLALRGRRKSNQKDQTWYLWLCLLHH